MNCIPDFPNFVTIDWNMRNELDAFFSKMTDALSEFSFPVLFLDTPFFNYKVSKISSNTCIICGTEKSNDTEKKFFIILGNFPEMPILSELLKNYGFWKNMPQSVYDSYEPYLTAAGYTVREDRNNFDYVYDRNQLAELKGKQFHKKKNLVNSFTAAYNADTKILDEQTRCDALSILDKWQKKRKKIDSDYESCRFALEHMEKLCITGFVSYASGIPVAFAAGALSHDNKTFFTFFEKGIDEYKGCYQYINMMTAVLLPNSVEFINREQDLGDEGLRQAKLTYRPIKFMRKYTVATQ